MATPNLNPTATNPITITATEDDSLWPEIEHNYFTSMRQHYDKEDRLLQAWYTARGKTLRKQLVQNYQACKELLRRLQELKDKYNGRQAELEGLDREIGGMMEARTRKREEEDKERRAWFKTYKRRVEGTASEEKDRAANGRDEDPDRTGTKDSALGTLVKGGAGQEQYTLKTPMVGKRLREDESNNEGGRARTDVATEQR